MIVLTYAVAFLLVVAAFAILGLARKYGILTDEEVASIRRAAIDKAILNRSGSSPEEIADAIMKNLPETVKGLKATKEQILEKAKNFKRT